MARFTREKPNAGYYIGMTVGETPEIWTVLRNIDEKTKKALAGSGGSWNPSSPIIVGGAGVELQCRAHFDTNSFVFPGPGKFFTFGEGYFRYPTGFPLVRTVVHHPVSGVGFVEIPGQWSVNMINLDPTNQCLSSLRPLARFRMPLNVHDGARISQVDTLYRVTSSHGPPAELPKMRIVKEDVSGIVTPLELDVVQLGFLASPDGWMRETAPADAAAYFNGGNLKMVQMYLDYAEETGHVIDTSRYAYAYEFIAEGGAGAASNGGNEIHAIQIHLRIPDLRPQ